MERYTSAGTEADMLDELLSKVRQDGLVLQEMVSDKHCKRKGV